MSLKDLKVFLFGNCCSFLTESFEAGSFIFWSPLKGKLDSGPQEFGSGSTQDV